MVDELKYVVRRKFPDKIAIVDTLLAEMNYEYVYTPDIIDETLFEIMTPTEFVERYC